MQRRAFNLKLSQIFITLILKPRQITDIDRRDLNAGYICQHVVCVVVAIVRHANARLFSLLVKLYFQRFTALNQGMKCINPGGTDADNGHFFHGDPCRKFDVLVGDYV